MMFLVYDTKFTVGKSKWIVDHWGKIDNRGNYPQEMSKGCSNLSYVACMSGLPDYILRVLTLGCIL